MNNTDVIRILSEMQTKRFTPENITSLKQNEVFVFGTNPEGEHKSMAAKLAVERFGAKIGEGEGLCGQSYAIPVHKHNTKEMAQAVLRFVGFAKSHPDLAFFVLPIGCGAAGMDVNTVAPMFRHAVELVNVYLPLAFIKSIKKSIVVKEDEPLPVKYVDEIINADRLRGRMMGLMAEISKRTSEPITFEDDILKKDNIFLFAFLRIAKVVTKEEQRVISALLDEAKKMSESGLGKESDNGTMRALELVHGWKIEANKIFDEGGCMYDLLEFTNPNVINTTMNIQSVKGFHGKLEDARFQRFEENGKYGLKGRNGEILLPAEYDKVNHSGYTGRGWHIMKDNKWGAVNERMEWIFPIEYDNIKLRYEGGHYLTKNGKVGFCDSEGKMMIDFLYDDLENYSSSWDGFKAKVDGKWGYVDKYGKVVIPIEYEQISLGSEGMILVKKDGKYGYYNVKKGTQIPLVYDYAYDFYSSHPQEAVVKQNDKFGVINPDGEFVLPLEYDKVDIDAPNVFRVKDGDYCGIIDKERRVLFPFKYRDLGAFNKDNIAYAANEKNLYGYVDRNGNVIVPFAYKRARSFDGNYAEVSTGWGSVGVINKQGKIVVPLRYESVMIHWDETAEVRIDDRLGRRYLCGLYDLKNGYVLPCDYERIEPLGRNREGIMECRCWKERDSVPVVVKVMSGSNNGMICYVEVENDEICGVYVNEQDCRSDNYVGVYAANGVLNLPTHFHGKRIRGVKDFWCMGGGGNRKETPKLKGLVIPETYEYIGQKDFSQYHSLEFLYLPNNVCLRSFAFAYCECLQKVYVGVPDETKQWSMTQLKAQDIYKDKWGAKVSGVFVDCHPNLKFFD